MFTDLGRKMFNGIVSDIPATVIRSKKSITPATPEADTPATPIKIDNVVEIPEFMRMKRMTYADSQARLYELSRMTKWQRIKRRISDFFYEEV